MNKESKTTVYFGRKEESYIKEFVESTDYHERMALYVEKIKPVFGKLVENIIFRYDFLNLTDNYEDLHQEVMSHLFLNIDKFKPEYGTKAYSYFGTAAKRYLQQKSISKTFENKNIEDIYDKEKGEINDDILRNAINLNDENKVAEDKEFIKVLIEGFENKKPKDEKEAKVLEAIVYFLKHYDSINIHNKKHCYILLREYTGLDTKTITKIINSQILEMYKKTKKQYINCEL